MSANAKNARKSKLTILGVGVLTGTLLLTGLGTADAFVPQPWSSPSDISDSGRTAYSPQVAVATDGTLTAVWERSNGTKKVIQTSTSADSGASWSNPIDLSNGSQDALNPQVAVSPVDGTIIAIWTRSNGNSFVIQTKNSVDNGASWSSATNLSVTTGDASDIEIAVSPEGVFTATWHHDNGLGTGGNPEYIIQTRTTTDHGGSWSHAVDLSEVGANAYYAQVAIAPGGARTAVWHRGGASSSRVQTSTSFDDGENWTPSADLPPANHIATRPRIAASMLDGSLTAVWEHTVSGNSVIQSSTSTTKGASWSAPVTLSTSGEDAKFAQIVIAPDGTRTAIWNRSDASNNIIQASTSIDKGTSWSTPVSLSASGIDSQRPQIAVASDGTLTATWYTGDNLNSVIQTRTSTDKGAHWTAIVNLSGASTSSGFPHVVVAPNGTATIVWHGLDDHNYIIRSAFSEATPVTVDRLAGSNRFMTSVEIAKEYLSADTVFVANGLGYPDALSAAPAAASMDAPLLLTYKDSLPADVKAEIVRLAPDHIFVVGGPGVVSDEVMNELTPLSTNIERLGGTNRYATSRIVFERIWLNKTAKDVFLADGRNFPDALSSASAAASRVGPVVLVDGGASGLPAGFGAMLQPFNTDRVVLAGGPAVLSSGIQSDLNNLPGITADRYYGGNRYATSVAINREFFGPTTDIFLAVGTGYADALAGAALAGKDDAPLYLVPGTCVPRPVLADITSLGVTHVTLLGGPGVLSPAVAALTPCN